MKTLSFAACLILCSSRSLAQASPPPSPEGYSYTPSVGEAPPVVEHEEEHRRTGSVWVLRGASFAGSGTAAQECDGEACPNSLEKTKYGEVASYALGMDWLYSSSRNFRIGLGLGLIPDLAVEESGERFELGTVVSADLVLEGVFDLSKKTALTLRGHVGMSVLVPSGDLESAASAQSDACFNLEQNSGVTCESKPGPYLGVQAGVGPGLLLDLGKLGLRLDLELQLYSFRTLEVKWAGSESALRFSGVRPMLLAGIEL